MRWNRPSAVAAACKLHVWAFHARARKLARGSAIREPLRRRTVDSTASLHRVFKAPHSDAAEST
eukprot:3699109-Lingulodinium_polyedra.AAC.1